MARSKEYEALYWSAFMFALLILGINIYYNCHPLLHAMGLTLKPLDFTVNRLRMGGLFERNAVMKLTVALLVILSTITRNGTEKKTTWRKIGIIGISGLVIYFIPFIKLPVLISSCWLYLFTTLTGLVLIADASILISRLGKGFGPHINDMEETFDQCRTLVKNDYSINFETQFKYQQKWHKGYINLCNPFRGTIIMGLPGSGKSFSVFNPTIETLLQKGFTMMLYDYKIPDLSIIAYNELLRNTDKYKVPPQFYCINFTDPRRSNRCNPIHPSYITDVVDAMESAQVIMDNLNKGNEKKDFFSMSGQLILGLCIGYLAQHKGGVYCDFPHVIELMNQPLDQLFSVLSGVPSLEGPVKIFADAMEAGAQDQLQGQIASAKLPLQQLSSPALYWVLSGNDFFLDINDPEAPKVVCIGNDPDRQEIYGAALSLMTFRTIKKINRKGKLPSALILDELPTIMIRGLDNLIATARSNKVATFLGMQDLSQLKRDYGDKNATVIFQNCGNYFVGQVNGETAERFNKELGKEFREEKSKSSGIDSESISTSYREQEILPVNKITSLRSGTFIGKVAIDEDTPVDKNFFAAKIKVNVEEFKRKAKENKPMPILTDFGLEEVRERLDNDLEYCREQVEKYLRKEVTREMTRPDASGKLPPEPEPWKINEEVSRRLESLSDKDIDKIIEKIIPSLEEQHINKILEENFYKIKQDIKTLMEEEYEPI